MDSTAVTIVDEVDNVDNIEGVSDDSLSVLNTLIDGKASNDIENTFAIVVKNQETIINQNAEIIYNLQEINSVLVNFFFVFGFLCVCKFIHFILCRVIFGGIN